MMSERIVYAFYKGFKSPEEIINLFEETGKFPTPTVTVQRKRGVGLDEVSDGIILERVLKIKDTDFAKLPADFFTAFDKPMSQDPRPKPKFKVGSRVRIAGYSNRSIFTVKDLYWTEDDHQYRLQDPPHYHYTVIEDPYALPDEMELTEVV